MTVHEPHALDQYAAWASARGAAKATVSGHLQALIHFDQFARDRGATTWADLPALVEPFVDQWMQKHGTRCAGDRARQSLRSHPRTPVEQTLRLLIPGFIGTTTRRPVPFQGTAPHFFDALRQEWALDAVVKTWFVRRLLDGRRWSASPVSLPARSARSSSITREDLHRDSARRFFSSSTIASGELASSSFFMRALSSASRRVRAMATVRFTA